MKMKFRKALILFLFFIVVTFLVHTFFFRLLLPKSETKSNKQHVKYVGSVFSNPRESKNDNKVRFVCFSDTHGFEIPDSEFPEEGDVILFSGDFSTYDRDMISEIEIFNDWMNTLPYPTKFVISGNHELFSLDGEDGILRPEDYQKLLTCCTYLYDKPAIIYPGNIKIFGTSFSPNMWEFLKDMHPSWKSFDDQYFFRREEKLAEIFSTMIPKDTNILLTHVPPFGVMDHQKFDRGSRSLMNVIETELVDLKVHVFGHVHHQSGWETIEVGKKRKILFINTSLNDKEFKDKVLTKTMGYFYVFDYHY